MQGKNEGKQTEMIHRFCDDDDDDVDGVVNRPRSNPNQPTKSPCPTGWLLAGLLVVVGGATERSGINKFISRAHKFCANGVFSDFYVYTHLQLVCTWSRRIYLALGPFRRLWQGVHVLEQEA